MKKVVFSLLFLFSFAFSDIILGVHPIANKDVVKKGMEPFAKYLEEQIGDKVTIFVGNDYKEGEDKLIKGEIDLLVISPFAMYKMIKNYYYIIPMAKIKLNNKTSYRGAIITHKNSTIKRIQDIKDKSFIFGDPSSTFAYGVPKRVLELAGVTPKKIYNVTTQLEIIKAIISGKVDAAGVKESFAKENMDKIKVIQYSKSLPTYAIAVNLRTVKRDKITKVKKAFLSFKGSIDMNPFGTIDGFIRTCSYEYEDVFK